jgi:hypothetical protein
VAHGVFDDLDQDLVADLEGLLDPGSDGRPGICLDVADVDTPFFGSPKSTNAASIPGSTLRTRPR